MPLNLTSLWRIDDDYWLHRPRVRGDRNEYWKRHSDMGFIAGDEIFARDNWTATAYDALNKFHAPEEENQ